MKVLNNLKINNESKKINASEIAVNTEAGKYKKLDKVLLEKYSADYSNNNVCINANEAIETGGWYTNADTTNLPINASGGYLDVKKHADGNLTQIWTRYRNNQIFIRHCNPVEPSGWKNWAAVSPSAKSYIVIEAGSDKSIGTGDNTINFDNVLAQNQLAFKNSSGVFTAKTDCVVSVNYHLNLNGSSGQVPIIRIWKNNTQLTQSGIQIYGGNCPISAANFIIPLNAGDTFKITLNGNSGNITARWHSYISVVEI